MAYELATCGVERPPARRAGAFTRADAFTLVELLVVIGIIAVLIGILMPALAKAREQANRTKCAANLHNWGQAAHMFAADNKGRFPMAFRNLTVNGRMLMKMTWTDNSAGDPNWWKKFGTSFEEWARYGMPEASLYCPSADRAHWDAGDSDGNWGPTRHVNYMYTGGLSEQNVAPTLANWGSAPPAAAQNDKDGSRRVLAADTVWWGSSAATGSLWGNSYEINHPRRNDQKLPEFQNLLYADGHVEGRGRDAYTQPLGTTNWSLNHYYAPYQNYFYWGPDQAAAVTTRGPV